MLSFPKGLIAAPGAVQRVGWLLKDNRGVLVALLGLALLIAFCIREWRRVGRDPRKGVIIARYEPPAGQTPASLRYLQRMSYDMRCFSSEVLALAVAGCLRIVREKRLLKDDWNLDRMDNSATAALPHSQRTLLERLFSGGRQSAGAEENKCEDRFCREESRIRARSTGCCNLATSSATPFSVESARHCRGQRRARAHDRRRRGEAAIVALGVADGG